VFFDPEHSLPFGEALLAPLSLSLSWSSGRGEQRSRFVGARQPFPFLSLSLTPGRSRETLEDPRTGRGVTAQNTTSLIAFGAGPVQSYASAAGLFTIVALLLQVLFRCIEVFALVRNFWEFVRFTGLPGHRGWGTWCVCLQLPATPADYSGDVDEVGGIGGIRGVLRF
jgi:hypothetical protein